MIPLIGHLLIAAPRMQPYSLHPEQSLLLTRPAPQPVLLVSRSITARSSSQSVHPHRPFGLLNTTPSRRVQSLGNEQPEAPSFPKSRLRLQFQKLFAVLLDGPCSPMMTTIS